MKINLNEITKTVLFDLGKRITELEERMMTVERWYNINQKGGASTKINKEENKDERKA